jgi:hypothetical protein
VRQVRLKWLQCLTSIVQHEDRQLVPPYIQTLLPAVFEHLHATADTAANTTAAKTSGAPIDLQLTLQELALGETLVALCEDDKRELHYFHIDKLC